MPRYMIAAPAVLALVAGSLAVAAPAQALGTTIYTVAGDGTKGNTCGSGGSATSAELNEPDGVAFNNSLLGLGIVYIADPKAEVVCQVNLLGGISVVAGTGAVGDSGDGGAATSATLDWPEAVAYNNGFLYIADLGNNVVRQVDPSTGIITTVVGDSVSGFSGDGSAADDAELAYPTALAFDSSGDLFIADSGNQRVREVVPDTAVAASLALADGTISTVAGDGAEGDSGNDVTAISTPLAEPSGLAVNTVGGATYLYVSSPDANEVVQVNLSTGTLYDYAGDGTKGRTGDGGAATSAELNAPHGLALDSSGDLYIADTGNSQVRVVDVSTGDISLEAGYADGALGYTGDDVAATDSKLFFPADVAISPLTGDLFIADTDNHRIRKVGLLDGIDLP